MVSGSQQVKGGDNTRFEDLALPELTVWRMYCLLGTVIPTHRYSKLTHPSAVHRIRRRERRNPMANSRFLQLIAFEYLPNNGFAWVVRIAQVQPIRHSDLPTPVFNLLHELPVFS